MFRLGLLFLLTIGSCSAIASDRVKSICHGTPEHGSLEHARALPLSGPNFQPYSRLGPALGRTYVHSAVHQIVVDAYTALAKSRPETRYMYGETGNASGGPFKPHRSHQNGLSVDFMVPVKDSAGKSVPLPTSPANKFGYDIEFSNEGTWERFTIDFPAMADHLHALEQAAQKKGIRIKRVIFDRPLQALLVAENRDTRLQGIPFATFTPWIRHDEHYHVDFDVTCER